MTKQTKPIEINITELDDFNGGARAGFGGGPRIAIFDGGDGADTKKPNKESGVSTVLSGGRGNDIL